MPLSEHEQRILAELEESLEQQDPAFAERVRTETVYHDAGRRCWWAALGFVAGLAFTIGLYSTSVILGFVGVAAMFACAVVFERNLRRMGKASWYDLNRSPGDEDSQAGSARLDGAVSDAREWFRSRFHRRDN